MDKYGYDYKDACEERAIAKDSLKTCPKVGVSRCPSPERTDGFRRELHTRDSWVSRCNGVKIRPRISLIYRFQFISANLFTRTAPPDLQQRVFQTTRIFLAYNVDLVLQL